MQIILDSFNLNSAERQLCEQALKGAGSIVGAAGLLGITRHALKRRGVELGKDEPAPEPKTNKKPRGPAPKASKKPRGGRKSK